MSWIELAVRHLCAYFMRRADCWFPTLTSVEPVRPKHEGIDQPARQGEIGVIAYVSQFIRLNRSIASVSFIPMHELRQEPALQSVRAALVKPAILSGIALIRRVCSVIDLRQ